MHMFFITCKFHHVLTIMYTHWLTYNEKKTPTTTKQVKPSLSTYFVSLTAYKMIFFLSKRYLFNPQVFTFNNSIFKFS